MRKLTSSSLALGLFLSFAVIGAAPAAGAIASPDRAVDRELVTIDMTAQGKIVRTSLVDSLSVFGNGIVQVTDRNEPKGLRNLAGFQGPVSVSGIDTTWKLNVHGEKEILTVAPQISRQAPVSVVPRYFIGQTQVTAAAMRGYTGDVTIAYELTNTTGRIQNFDVTDKMGKKSSVPLETFVPFVAQTSFELPSSMWRSIDAPDASIVTDDNNLNHVTFTSLLMPLVGSPTQTVKLSGRVKNLEMRETRIVFQPLLPGGAQETASKTFDGASKLFAGVGAVDTNLGKLQTGTVQLIGGLQQLYQGILDARAGLGSVGNKTTIVGGLKQVLDGLKSLGDSKAGVPAIKAGVDQLISGVDQAIAGFGSSSANGTILNGLAQVSGGLNQLGASTGLSAAKSGVDQVNTGLTSAKAGLLGLQAAVGGSVAEIQGAFATLGCPGSLNPACPLLDSALNSSHGLATVTSPGLASLAAGTDLAKAGLGQVSAGLGGAIGAVGQLGAGVSAVTAGVNQIKAALKSGNPNNPGILEGLESVAGGLTKVIAGVGTVGTANSLTDGADQLFSGSKSLAAGVDQIATGTNTAKAGATQIAGGQGDLSKKGTSVIQAGIGDNILQASTALAVLASMKQRATDESSLYGPPQGSPGSTTYVLRVGGITARNVQTAIKFAVGILLLFILAGAGVTAGRRATMAV